ncbi:MAG: hypothetical protein ACE366_04280 [Bradymonadia bacterium]
MHVTLSRTTLTTLAAGALAACVLTAGTASAENEAVSYGIDEFSSQCGSSDLSRSITFAENFDEVFDNWISEGKWGQSSLKTDANVDDYDWTDASKQGWGDDNDDNRGADHADVAFISTHGVSPTGGAYTSIKMGDATTSGEGGNDVCSVRTDNHMHFGSDGGDLEIVILAACETGQYKVWDNGNYDGSRHRDGRLRTWLGFHGISYDTLAGRITDYAESSYYNGLGDNWIDEMYRNRWGSDNDECPTSIIYGESTSEMNSQHDYGGFNDRNKSGTVKNKRKIFYIDGCDPKSAPEL